jgi:hypothetical protein
MPRLLEVQGLTRALWITDIRDLLAGALAAFRFSFGLRVLYSVHA